ncbi:alpha-hydroxy acid oxidase [Kocuria rhizophila]|uniref:Putative L-lactate dehydrogenase n=1 Tax=Kocuria rhizophila (strain ATCC 9341 / DSM 348 / NBRC 103217 / DC2201) TaxID=378753 RepID=B2GHA4_KOCRD|nr:alpha-hydroxy acid oxidase [Kocuria rhizophila]ASE10530.1 alpha-hydroxy-acid oxidizing protein [Kocuria rhizophila]BAG29577.1 putative L-lactate dehydrogenase [Kocuria rhizophila DC2201]VEH75144.1 L-lactate dehydrogenase [cytochrome] [Kocuria rhizophila]
MERHLPQLSELKPLMQFGSFNPDRRAARLAKAADVEALRRIARRRTPKPAFDYVDGAAGQELTYRRSREAFESVELLPRILHGTDTADLSTEITGFRSALPFGIAPTGFTRFMHSEGEIGGVRAAERAGIPFSLSTMGTRSIEEVRDAAPDAERWFQLYLWREHDASLDLIRRAKAAGTTTLLVTVDTPVPGQRLRDTRNGMVIPPRLTPKTVLDASYRPEWWFNFLTTDSLKFASLSDTSGALADLISTMFDPGLNLADLEWIREQWDGTLYVKGVLTREDARRAMSVGADGLVVSNHGGRQLDRAPVSLTALPELRDEVGPDVPLILDSGVLSGADVVTALCAGADFVLIGRAYLYGLMAGGEQGVSRVIELLEAQIRTTMMLMGAASTADLGPHGMRAPWLPREERVPRG